MDKYTGQTNSSIITINVHGPVVIPQYPAEGEVVNSPVTLQYLVRKKKRGGQEGEGGNFVFFCFYERIHSIRNNTLTILFSFLFLFFSQVTQNGPAQGPDSITLTLLSSKQVITLSSPWITNLGKLPNGPVTVSIYASMKLFFYLNFSVFLGCWSKNSFSQKVILCKAPYYFVLSFCGIVR